MIKNSIIILTNLALYALYGALMWHWSRHAHMHAQCGRESSTKREMKREVLFTSLPALSCVHSQACTRNSILCMSRYAYDVNITLNLLLLNTFRVCSFITLSVLIKQNEFELNWQSLPFAPQTEFSVSSRGFNVFTLTCGKQRINVTDYR